MNSSQHNSSKVSAKNAMIEEIKKIDDEGSEDSNPDCSAETPNNQRVVGILRHASSRIESSDVLSSDSGEYSDPLGNDDSIPMRESEEEKTPPINNTSSQRN